MRPVIFFSNGKNVIYSIKDNAVLNDEYVSYYSGFIDFNRTGEREIKAHFDSKTYFKAEKTAILMMFTILMKNNGNAQQTILPP